MSGKLFLLMSMLFAFVGVFTACANGETQVEGVETPAVANVATQQLTQNVRTYTGSAQGHGGTLVAQVSVVGDDIDDIVDVEIISHNETYMFYQLPFERIISSLLNYGSLNVDNVVGATLTSMAARFAIMEALNEAGFDTVAMITMPTETREPQTVNLTTDIVVIGGGGAGLSAAVQAGQLGASVIVVEKLEILGGNTLVAGSAMQVSGTRQQAAAGIEDSPDLHFEHTFSGGDYAANPELVRVMVDNALEAAYWLEDLGVEWAEHVVVAGGTTFPRALNVMGPIGSAWIRALENFINTTDGDMEILMGTRATEVISENGRAVGIRATNRYNDEITIMATNGVIMATGGFAANVEMRMYHDELWNDMLDASIPHTNISGAQGDGIRMAQEIGANVIDMGYIQLLSFGCPQDGSPFNFVGGGTGMSFMVNEQGARFVDENARRDDLTLALFEQTNSRMFMLTDSRFVSPEHSDRLVYYGFVYRADTIEELAEITGMDINTLMANIEQFPRLQSGEIACPFGRDFETMPQGEIDFNYPPFHASPRVPTIHHTMGGIQIDTYARVLDASGNIISGFYAAGEVTGGIHGTNRLGGNAITDVFVFGRIAGESAVLGR